MYGPNMQESERQEKCWSGDIADSVRRGFQRTDRLGGGCRNFVLSYNV